MIWTASKIFVIGLFRFWFIHLSVNIDMNFKRIIYFGNY
jgi:hypothetical protein